MDSEIEKEKDKTRRAPGTGEQYLAALIKCADWVPRAYKQLAEKNKANVEVLKELYLCSCDNVPVEKALEALEKKPPEGALRFVRQKQIENALVGNYKEELSGIKKTTFSMEQEVKQMSETLNHIVTHVPNFDAMFPDQPVEKVVDLPAAMQEHIAKGNAANTAESKTDKRNTDKNNTDKNNIDKASADKERIDKERIDKAGERKARASDICKRIKKSCGRFLHRASVTDFVTQCVAEGYSEEQMTYLLDCLEDGSSIEELHRFASPVLPVEVMKRLQQMENREESADGK